MLEGAYKTGRDWFTCCEIARRTINTSRKTATSHRKEDVMSNSLRTGAFRAALIFTLASLLGMGLCVQAFAAEGAAPSAQDNFVSERAGDASGTALTFHGNPSSAQTPTSVAPEQATETEMMPQTGDIPLALPFALTAALGAVIALISWQKIKHSRKRGMCISNACLPKNPDWVWPQNWRS